MGAGTVLIAAAVALAVLVVQGGAGATPTIPRSALRLSIGAAPVSRPVPGGFVGFSVEYPSMITYAGRDPAALDPVFLALVRDLTPGQSPVLRFGGDTTDWSWWTTPGVAKPGGIRYIVGPRWAAVTAATARTLGARLILGINFESDRAAIAATEASALVRAIGLRFIAGLELGNEPEVYGSLGWYSTPSRTPVLGRAPSYDFRSFLPDYRAVSSALPGDVPLAGPASGAAAWLSGLGQFLASAPRVRVVTFHRYPLHRCFTPRSSPDFPSVTNLLAPVAASGPATSLQAAVRVAHAHGLAFRADELNSVSCGGARGVSDTFASALWVLDTLLHMAAVGVDGVNIHTFKKAVYEPFAFAHAGGRWQAEVKPLYYGLLMFTRAAPPGSRLVATTVAPVAGLRTWATRAPDGSFRLLLINESRRRALIIAARPASPARAATVIRLRAPGLRATRGVTLGGQSFATPTTTGRLAGAPRPVSLIPIRGRYVVRVPAASATLLTLAGGAAR